MRLGGPVFGTSLQVDLAAATDEYITNPHLFPFRTTKHRKHQRTQAVSVSGQVQLDISYFAKSGSLTVHVLQCSKLAPVSKRRTTSNP